MKREKARQIELEIESLVVHGVSAGDSDRLLAVIERELTTLFEKSQQLREGRAEIPGGAYELPAGLDVDGIGKGVARQIWEISTEERSSAPRQQTAPGPEGRLTSLDDRNHSGDSA